MSIQRLTFGFITIAFALLSCTGQDNAQSVQGDEAASDFRLPVTEIDSRIWSIYQDQNGHHWFGSNGSGVYLYDGEELINYTRLDGLADNQIRGIQGDHLGNVFIETPSGVSKYDGQTFTTLEIISSESNEWKLESTDLWFSCNGHANHIYRYDGEVLYELALPKQDLKGALQTDGLGLGFQDMNNSPYSVCGIDIDSHGNLWIGTFVAAAFRYDGESFLWFGEKELGVLPDGRVPGVRKLIEDKDGNFWLSNFLHKYRIDSDSSYTKLEAIPMENELFQERLPYFMSAFVDEEGILWAASYGGGVWQYDGKDLTNFPVKEGNTEALIVSIYPDNEGILWVGTDNLGVFRHNGTTFEKFTVGS